MKRRIVTGAILAIGALSLSACSSLAAVTSNDIIGKSTENDSSIKAATTNVDDGETLDAGGRVQYAAVAPWILESVSMSGTTGNDVEGVALPGKKWQSKPLAPGQMSTYTATMRNQQTGDVTVVARKALAGPAQGYFDAKLTPDQGTYGVGIVPAVEFSKEVPVQDRKAITDRFKVASKQGAIPGAWRWTDADTAKFRPAPRKGSIFWPANQTVVITGDLKDAMISGENGEPPAWGNSTVSTGFKTGREFIVNIDGDNHSGNVVVNGKEVKEFGVSLGKSGYTTRSGIKTLTDKHEVQRMTNEGVTTEEVYDLQVPYAMRLTDTGEFLHAAPWNGNIGSANTSHGCSNLTYDDAVWVYDNMLYGDPVITIGTDRPMESGNGEGAVYNIPYRQWGSIDGPLEY